MVLKRKNSLKKICNTLVRPGLMLRNKNEDSAPVPESSSPPTPGSETKSQDVEVRYIPSGEARDHRDPSCHVSENSMLSA